MKSVNLLLVEDDAGLGETLKERLEKENYGVHWATTLADAKASVEAQSFDIVVMDVGLPDGSGFDLARHLIDRKALRTPPFLFMTAMNSAENRLEGYEIGAEEFIPKPFHLKELLMRIAHVLKNHAPVDQLQLNDRRVDFQSRRVEMNGGPGEFLQERDAALLHLLIARAPHVVSRDEILNEIWGEDKFPSHRTVDNAIVRLRQALGEGGNFIRSARGVGYQWVPNEMGGGS